MKGTYGQEPRWKYCLRLVLNILIPAAGWLLLLFAGPWLLKFFMPFVIGFIIAWIANPLVRLLERRLRLVRRHSSLLIVAAVLALVIGLLYLVISRAIWVGRAFVEYLPQLYRTVETEIQQGLDRLGESLTFLPDGVLGSWEALGSSLGDYLGLAVEKAAPPTVEAAGSVARSIPAFLVYAVVAVLSAYFFTVERDRMGEFLREHLPAGAWRYQRYLKGEAKRLIGGYFMAQFKIMVVVCLILTAGFLVLGVRFAPLWALFVSILDFLPVFGTGTALIPWGIIKVLDGEYAFAAGLLLLYVLTQVTRQAVQPKLVGDSMGLNPFLTLLFLYLGFKAGGIAGMILAVPIGLLFLNLYRYGAFKGMTDSAAALVREIQSFRKGEDIDHSRSGERDDEREK